MVWILADFERVSEILQKSLLSNPSSSSSNALSRPKLNAHSLETLVGGLIQKIDHDMSDIIRSLDIAIPLSAQASADASQLARALRSTNFDQTREADMQPALVSFLNSLKGGEPAWRQKQLQRDIKLSLTSIERVSGVRYALEKTRAGFVDYQKSIGYFKAGIVGAHLSGGRTAAEELRALSAVMDNFRMTLAVAKRSRQPKNSQMREID